MVESAGAQWVFSSETDLRQSSPRQSFLWILTENEVSLATEKNVQLSLEASEMERQHFERGDADPGPRTCVWSIYSVLMSVTSSDI